MVLRCKSISNILRNRDEAVAKLSWRYAYLARFVCYHNYLPRTESQLCLLLGTAEFTFPFCFWLYLILIEEGQITKDLFLHMSQHASCV